ncbi:hypothetical protein HCJ82_02475 [Listeria booriae]|uniref:CpsB/CapC family capsule biosynthesis tyrosine phosphatase n=1 Tax=Listeria booriae TaxID=1552123 RepID=UPI001627EDBC|nr:CpsB/CapC family capsule biosynthesis tyrosine phosphatase [Listeria booriae]MBC2179024.1 hypothetical protein [Listeria booriae]
MQLIDINNHLLPGYKTGAKVMRDSIRMSSQLVENGVQKVIATPFSLGEDNWETIKTSVALLQEELYKYDIPLTILPGRELHVTRAWLTNWQEDIILRESPHTLFFIESQDDLPALENVFFQMNVSRQKPILVQPERINFFQKDEKKLQNMLLHGAYIQLHAGSLLGDFGWKTKRFAWRLLESGDVFVIASGAIDATKKSCQLKEAYQGIAKRMGPEFVNTLQANAWSLGNKEVSSSLSQIEIKKGEEGTQ